MLCHVLSCFSCAGRIFGCPFRRNAAGFAHPIPVASHCTSPIFGTDGGGTPVLRPREGACEEIGFVGSCARGPRPSRRPGLPSRRRGTAIRGPSLTVCARRSHSRQSWTAHACRERPGWAPDRGPGRPCLSGFVSFPDGRLTLQFLHMLVRGGKRGGKVHGRSSALCHVLSCSPCRHRSSVVPFLHIVPPIAFRSAPFRPRPAGLATLKRRDPFCARILRARPRLPARVSAGAVRAPDCARETEGARLPFVPAGAFFGPSPCFPAQKSRKAAP